MSNLSTLTSSGNPYSWTIAQVTGGAPTLPAGVAVPASTTLGASTDNLLTDTSGGANPVFALDTSGFTIDGATGNSIPSSNFSLEFVGTGSGDNLILDYSSAPEPGTIMLVLGGAVPMLMGRRRRKTRSI